MNKEISELNVGDKFNRIRIRDGKEVELTVNKKVDNGEYIMVSMIEKEVVK